ncbi:DUF975 family protein [Bacillus sp. FJAT-27916]|uniref:DUF975 family protein n=1 Tax=Bacillus sp. FJAT-27916 TaxID=1679169 RepID=UPI00067140DA|nr:DUF975 family protein [Bacillus sp. FJAT-27916]
MEFAAKDYRQIARNKLKGHWGLAIGVFFTVALITSAIDALAQDYYYVYWILLLFISVPLSVGQLWFFQDVERGETLTYSHLFDTFRKDYVRTLTAMLLVYLYTFLWSLLLIIPGIVKGLSYSMTMFVLRDHPEMTASEAIKESQRLMYGKKFDLFKLILSFIGYVILPWVLIGAGIVLMIAQVGIAGIVESAGLMAIGIASGTILALIGLALFFAINIYLTPYILTSLAAFYDKYVTTSVVTPEE